MHGSSCPHPARLSSEALRCPPFRYCAGTMPWGHPGEHHDFEPQRHDDGYLEVIGFTMTSLVSGPARALPEAPAALPAWPGPTLLTSTVPRWEWGSPNVPSLTGGSVSSSL